MGEADLVVVVGRKLDYQLGYGSPAVFPNARFIRIADNAGELIDNRRGAARTLRDARSGACSASSMPRETRNPTSTMPGPRGFADKHLDAYRARPKRVRPATADRRQDPSRPRSLTRIREVADPDYIAIADGGDILSFARVGLESPDLSGLRAFGCLGVGVPFAVAAALAFPDRQVILVTGDGAFGFNAMEIDTAVRHGAKAVFIVSNNAAWNIERYDQEVNYGGRVVGTMLRHSDYAGMGRALGFMASVEEPRTQLRPALRRALDNAPALIDCGHLADRGSSDARKGLGVVPDYQPLTAWDDAETAPRGEAASQQAGERKTNERAAHHRARCFRRSARLLPDRLARRSERAPDLSGMECPDLSFWPMRCLGLGLRKGDRVAVLAYNCVEWAEIYAAAAKSGLVAVPINFRLVGPEIRYIVEDAGASALIVQDALVHRNRNEIRGNL